MNTIASLWLIFACITATNRVLYGHDHGYHHDNITKLTEVNPQKQSTDKLSYVYRVDTNEFAFHVALVQVALDTNERKIICQGALVTNDWFISSAYCIWLNTDKINFDSTKAIIGTQDYTSPNAVVHSILFYMFHPYFNTTIGYGNDVIMMMIEQSVNSHSDSIGVVYILDPSETIKTNCKYSSYVEQYLYWNEATLDLFEIDCDNIGISDDLSYCVIMNDTLHEKNKKYDFGSPLTCGDNNMLYAIRNYCGYFTTIFETADWVIRMIDEGSRVNMVYNKLNELQQLDNKTISREETVDKLF